MCPPAYRRLISGVIHNNADEAAPCYSPDGKKIAYMVYSNASGNTQIYTIYVGGEIRPELRVADSLPTPPTAKGSPTRCPKANPGKTSSQSTPSEGVRPNSPTPERTKAVLPGGVVRNKPPHKRPAGSADAALSG
jgi:hypothetical protein